MGTLLAFVDGFGAFDLLLQFVLQHFFDELSSSDEEKVVEIVNGASQGGVASDATLGAWHQVFREAGHGLRRGTVVGA